MRSFKFVSISESFAHRVRETRADEYGNHSLAPRAATSKPGFPCRICLRDAEEGEALLLCGYSPFTRPAPHRSMGPVFIHEKPCGPFVDRGEIPEMLRERMLSLRAYDDRDELVHAELANGGLELLERASDAFKDPTVHHIDVHIARPGCFACHLERS